MANYYGSARSNYFHVKDEAAFEKDMGELIGIDVRKHTNDASLFCILGDDADGYNWNVLVIDDEDSGDYESVDLPAEVAKHLPDNEVAVFIEAGSEKLRYIFGNATAINNKGDAVVIALSDIYARAKEELTDQSKDITLAEY